MFCSKTESFSTNRFVTAEHVDNFSETLLDSFLQGEQVGKELVRALWMACLAAM